MVRHWTPALLTFLLLWTPGKAVAGTSHSSHAVITQPSVRKATTTITHEQITVWGRQKLFFPAPLPNNNLSERGNQTGFGPGSKLGIATIEGGPVYDQVHNGVTAGIAIPVPGVRDLDFTLAATGSRDAMAASGINGAASATAGLRLKF